MCCVERECITLIRPMLNCPSPKFDIAVLALRWIQRWKQTLWRWKLLFGIVSAKHHVSHSVENKQSCGLNSERETKVKQAVLSFKPFSKLKFSLTFTFQGGLFWLGSAVSRLIGSNTCLQSFVCVMHQILDLCLSCLMHDGTVTWESDWSSNSPWFCGATVACLAQGECIPQVALQAACNRICWICLETTKAHHILHDETSCGNRNFSWSWGFKLWNYDFWLKLWCRSLFLLIILLGRDGCCTGEWQFDTFGLQILRVRGCSKGSCKTTSYTARSDINRSVTCWFRGSRCGNEKNGLEMQTPHGVLRWSEWKHLTALCTLARRLWPGREVEWICETATNATNSKPGIAIGIARLHTIRGSRRFKVLIFSSASTPLTSLTAFSSIPGLFKQFVKAPWPSNANLCYGCAAAVLSENRKNWLLLDPGCAWSAVDAACKKHGQSDSDASNLISMSIELLDVWLTFHSVAV